MQFLTHMFIIPPYIAYLIRLLLFFQANHLVQAIRVRVELKYMVDVDKKIFMIITLNFYIVVYKSYLYNYIKKITI